MIQDKQIKPEAWIEVLKAGGTKSPLELAKMVGVDLSTDQVLSEVIEEITNTIDDIIQARKQA
jgi:oligoendopeptidase F